MNPTGLRLEEKKSADQDLRSISSYKSTQSSRSSVLQRARDYNRRIETEKRRSQSLERGSLDNTNNNNNDTAATTNHRAPDNSSSSTPRSQSAGRVRRCSPQPQGVMTRERALDSVQRDVSRQQQQTNNNTNNKSNRQSFSSAQSARRSQTAAQQQQPPATSTRDSPSRKSKTNDTPDDTNNNIVTPELLVDALSGHEDGLLAIAEKLMEHYDSGYDVMGEAIIDAFADVQKLFQHVVEAAHMEGAAFEASRRESEQQPTLDDPVLPSTPNTPTTGPTRHDEFIDQDVKDILTNAIRQGTALRDTNRHDACYELYEQACQAASSLLPVDSDHRGRLQLSLARAESMSPDRACAILRYAMDDVLRSGMRAGQTPNPHVSQRADVVLAKPHLNNNKVVQQSADEALASLMEELKEILEAPVYLETPLQAVAQRFWAALHDAQKTQSKTAERLEQNLAQLKGEFLLARAEWEEKLTHSNEQVETYKKKYQRLKEEQHNTGDGYMDQARSFAHTMSQPSADESSMFGGKSSFPTPGKAGSVASLGNELAQQAKTIVTQMNKNFNCNNAQPNANEEEDYTEENERTPHRSRSRSARRHQDV